MSTSKKGKHSLADLNAFLKQQQADSPRIRTAEDFVRQTPRSLVDTAAEPEVTPVAGKAEGSETSRTQADQAPATPSAEVSAATIAAQIQAIADAQGVPFQQVYAEVLLHQSRPALPLPLRLADYAFAYATFPLTLLRCWQASWLR